MAYGARGLGLHLLRGVWSLDGELGLVYLHHTGMRGGWVAKIYGRNEKQESIDYTNIYSRQSSLHDSTRVRSPSGRAFSRLSSLFKSSSPGGWLLAGWWGRVTRAAPELLPQSTHQLTAGSCTHSWLGIESLNSPTYSTVSHFAISEVRTAATRQPS